MTSADQALLHAVKAALDADPFAGVLKVQDMTLSRSEARFIERRLFRKARAERRAA